MNMPEFARLDAKKFWFILVAALALALALYYGTARRAEKGTVGEGAIPLTPEMRHRLLERMAAEPSALAPLPFPQKKKLLSQMTPVTSDGSAVKPAQSSVQPSPPAALPAVPATVIPSAEKLKVLETMQKKSP